jgi:hypothetical protein
MIQIRRLFKFILFPSVSSRLLKQEFSKLKAEEIDSELLEMLKIRLFCEIKTEDIIFQPNRYEKENNTIEINNHQGIISQFRKEDANSISIEASSFYSSSS